MKEEIDRLLAEGPGAKSVYFEISDWFDEDSRDQVETVIENGPRRVDRVLFGQEGSAVEFARWNTPAAFFPWPYAQRYINRIDSTVYHAAIEMAQQEFPSARPCPSCGRPAGELFWFSITDPEAAWDAGTGRVGFLTVCRRCRIQVEFLLDRELTDMQAEQWRKSRTLA